MPQAASLKETLTIALTILLLASLIAPLHANPVEVATEEELHQALVNEDPEIKLTADIELVKGKELDIEYRVSIDGNGFTIDGTQNEKSIFNILDAEITLNNLTLLGGTTEHGGGAITTVDALTIHGSNLLFQSNIADGESGGAVDVWDNVLFTGSNITFRDNKTEDDAPSVEAGGGAIAAQGVTLGTNFYFSGNSTHGRGGAILASGDGNNIEFKIFGNTFFENNSANLRGGAIFMDGVTNSSTLTLDTTAGHIAFAGNKHLLADSPNGTANSINMERGTNLLLTGGHNVYFDDPISTAPDDGENNSLTVNLTGTGFVQFGNGSDPSNHRLNANGMTGGEVNVNSGTFRIAPNAVFNTGGSDDKQFNVASGATLAGGAPGQAESSGLIRSQNGFIISGNISPDSYIHFKPAWEAETNSFSPTGGGREGTEFGRMYLATIGAANVTFTDSSFYYFELTIDEGSGDYNHDLLVVQGWEVDNGGTIIIQNGAKLAVTLEGTPEEGQYFFVICANNANFGSDDAYFTIVNADNPGAGNSFTGGYFESFIGEYELDPGVTDDGYWIIWHASALAPSGEVFASGQLVTADLQRAFQRRLPSAFARLPNNRDGGLYRGMSPCDPCGTESRGLCSRSWNRWASFTGNVFDRKSFGSSSAYNLRSAGIMAGFDRQVTRNSFGGVAFGYDNAYQKFSSIEASNRVDAFRSMLYGGIVNRNDYADGYIGYTKNWHQTRREANDTTARSKFNDDLFSTGFELGRRLSFAATRSASLAPSVGLHYIHLSTPGITELGAGAADLYVHSGKYNSLRMPVGAKLNRELRSRNGIVWTPELRAYYIREFADDSVRALTSFSNNRAVSSLTDSGSWGRNSGRLGVGLDTQLSDRIHFRVDYDYEVFDHTSLSEFGASLEVRW